MQNLAYQNLINSINEINEKLSSLSSKDLNNQLFDIPQTCEYLRVSRKTLFNYRVQGLINFIQLNKSILFRYSDLQIFLNNYQVKAFNNKKNNKK